MILKKYSVLTQNNGNLTLNDRKILNYLLYIKQTQNSKNKIYITSIGSIKDFLNVKNNNKTIKQSLQNLTTKSITTNILKKEKNIDTQIFQPLSYLKYNEDFSIEFKFDSEIENLTTAINIYSNLNLKDMIHFKSKYSLIIFELINDYKKISKLPTITIEDFKLLIGSSYNNFSLINEKILKPVQKEINNKTVFNIDFKTQKYGRKIKLIDLIFEDITKNKRFKSFVQFMLNNYNNVELRTRTQTIVISKKLTQIRWKIIFQNREVFSNQISLKEFELFCGIK